MAGISMKSRKLVTRSGIVGEQRDVGGNKIAFEIGPIFARQGLAMAEQLGLIAGISMNSRKWGIRSGIVLQGAGKGLAIVGTDCAIGLHRGHPGIIVCACTCNSQNSF